MLHELGHEEAGPLLAAATAEQLQVVLDFAVWQRDRIAPDALAEWLEAMAHAPPERIGAGWRAWTWSWSRWCCGVARAFTIFSQGASPRTSPQGTFFPTPDNLFVLDVVGLPGEDGVMPADADEHDRAAVIIRLVDSLYRSDKDLARRLLVAATSELDSELEETAYRWQRGRMADLGFADYYEALEVYRELDLASVRIGEGNSRPVRSTVDAADGDGTGAARPDGARAAPDRRGRIALRARGAEAGGGRRESTSCVSRWWR